MTTATSPGRTARASRVPVRVVDHRPDGGLVSATFPRDLPVLAGHYPGFPIVPGVLLVEVAEQAARALAAQPAMRWTAIPATRFRSPVLPGDAVLVDVRLEESGVGGTTARCVLTVGGRPVADVRLVFDGGLPPDSPAAGGPAADLSPHPVASPCPHRDLRSVLPHRHPILLVDRVTRVVPGLWIEAVKAISVSEPCMADEPTTAAYPWPLTVESWCQSAGLLAAWTAPNPDVLTGDVMLFGGISGIELHRAPHPGEFLVHQAELVREAAGTQIVTGTTRASDGALVMRVERITMVRRPASVLTGTGDA